MSPIPGAPEFVFTEDTQTDIVDTELSLGILCKNKRGGPCDRGHVVDEGRVEHVETPLCDAHSSPANVLLPSNFSSLDYRWTQEYFDIPVIPYYFNDPDYMISQYTESLHPPYDSDAPFDSGDFSLEQTEMAVPALNNLQNNLEKAPIGAFSFTAGLEPSTQSSSNYAASPVLSTRTSNTPKSVSSPETNGATILTCTWDLCKKTFPSRTEYTKHVQNHSRPFQCPHPSCPARRATKRHLDRHINERHFQTERYYCTVPACKKSRAEGWKGFPREDNCRRHMKTQHQLTWEKERHCEMDEETKRIRRARQVGTRGLSQELLHWNSVEERERKD